MIGLMPSNVLAASKPTVTKKITINVRQSKTIVYANLNLGHMAH